MGFDPATIRNIMSGQDRSLAAGVIRLATSAASQGYAAIIGIRNFLYDREWIRSVELGRRTVSVGNLTTGGTGKTPMVLWIAQAAITRGLRPAVLMRGYGGSDGDSDEASELRQAIPGLLVGVGADRVKAAKPTPGGTSRDRSVHSRRRISTPPGSTGYRLGSRERYRSVRIRTAASKRHVARVALRRSTGTAGLCYAQRLSLERAVKSDSGEDQRRLAGRADRLRRGAAFRRSMVRCGTSRLRR